MAVDTFVWLNFILDYFIPMCNATIPKVKCLNVTFRNPAFSKMLLIFSAGGKFIADVPRYL